MILAGPRVLHVIGQDYRAFRWLASTNRHAIPTVAICVQSALTLLFVWTASFESILVFAGFTLGVSTFLTVAGVFVLRWRQPDLERPFRVTGYPLPPLIYLSVTGWTLGYILVQRPNEAWMGLTLLGAGGAFYWLSTRLPRKTATRG